MAMEIVFVVLIIAIIIFVGKVAWGARIPSRSRSTVEEQKDVSFEELEALSRESKRNTGTDVLRVYLQQYEDLKKRIEEKDPEILEHLDERGIKHSLMALEHTKEELRRRNAL